MKKTACLIAFAVISVTLAAQAGYTFKPVKDIRVTSVKNQGSTGTCWSFATVSFLEAELLRLTGQEYDLSEMFFVRKAYEDKAARFVRWAGNNPYGQGGQAHDVLNVLKKFGAVNETDYSGLLPGQDRYNHSEMVAMLSSITDGLAKSRSGALTENWPRVVNSILDVYIGETPKGVLTNLPVNPGDYVEITSYIHHPFYTRFALEIPDNWSRDLYYNVPLDELMAIMNNALENGYTVDWDGDVSDKGFSHKNGVAIMPDLKLEFTSGKAAEPWKAMTEADRTAKMYAFEGPVPEQKVSQQARQRVFDNYATTDDHLMHLTGMVKDQNGTVYYKTKNSWGADSNKFGGYLNMSEPYVRMNTVAILVHKDAIPQAIRAKMGL